MLTAHQGPKEDQRVDYRIDQGSGLLGSLGALSKVLFKHQVKCPVAFATQPHVRPSKSQL